MDTSTHHTFVPVNGPNQVKSGSKCQLIVFKLGSEEYALVIDQIKEVVITPRIARIPLTPEYIKGVANVRGNILAIVDLEARFGLAADSENKGNQAHNYTLVVASEEFKMGVLVKEVPNTLTVQESEVDWSPGLIQDGGANSSCIRGIVRSGNRMIILIDIYKVIPREEITPAVTAKVA